MQLKRSKTWKRKYGWTFGPDGEGSFSNPLPFEQRLAASLSPERRLAYRKTYYRGSQYLMDFTSLANEKGIAVICMITPRHPEFLDKYFESPQEIDRHKNNAKNDMQSLQSQYNNVYFLDYSTLNEEDGLDTSGTGFSDGCHILQTNSNLVLSLAGDTIHKAYQWANGHRK